MPKRLFPSPFMKEITGLTSHLPNPSLKLPSGNPTRSTDYENRQFERRDQNHRKGLYRTLTPMAVISNNEYANSITLSHDI
ncbi:MAG: hypothetical protein KDF59_11385 [Nitrosomonas sp.]|nr:hypothetical protein [Nitrosomonas sp.]